MAELNPDTPIRIPFNGSPRPTLGVELELQLVDPVTLNLTQASPAILDHVGDHPKIKQELTQSTIEVITGICEDVTGAVDDLTESILQINEIADTQGFAVSSAGTHPFAQWREQKVFPNERYQNLVDRIQWPARRLLIYGLHVHVGISSGEKCIAVLNGLTAYLPHMLALSASSPFIDFEDTGLASSRTKVFEGMPTAGLPYRLANYGEFQGFMNTLKRARAIETIREIWWDIRPHPTFGTVEVRICDAPSTFKELAALTSLIQTLVVWLGDRYENGIPLPSLNRWVVRENKWRATRHGLEAEVLLDNFGHHMPLRDHLPDLIERILPTAEKLGCNDTLEGCLAILDQGASYERQREVFKETGRLPDIVGHLANEFRESVRGRETRREKA